MEKSNLINDNIISNTCAYILCIAVTYWYRLKWSANYIDLQ